MSQDLQATIDLAWEGRASLTAANSPQVREAVEQVIADELDHQRKTVDAARFAAYEKAADLMRTLVRSPRFIDFLTLPAYDRILKEEAAA